MKKVRLSYFSRDCDAEIIEEKEDEMETVVKCPYCGSITTVRKTIPICGYVGCDKCYWGENGLLKTVVNLRKRNWDQYVSGKFYRKGYRGNNKPQKSILDDAETEYLKAIIKPFRNRIKCIVKDDNFGKEFICINLGDDEFSLPYFEPDTMYKGMELHTPYTLDELGL